MAVVAIETRNLTREFRLPVKGQSMWRRFFAPLFEMRAAVSDVTLSINTGEMVGYIGPNGAGKSTTIKMLLGVLHPTRGELFILGRSPFRERIQNNMDVGVVWGHRNYLTWDIPVIDSFERYRLVFQVSRADFAARLRLCQEYLEIDHLLHVHARQLSLGQRVRCNLANVMLHRPRILYLDEPTIGLDVLAKHQVRRFLRHVNREWGTTILLTTHDLGDIEDLCPRILVIDRGRVILDDKLDTVRDRFGPGVRIMFQFRPDTVIAPDFPHQLQAKLPGVRVQLEAGRLTAYTARTRAAPAAVIREVINRLEPTDLKVQEAPIEEVVKAIYAGGVHAGH